MTELKSCPDRYDGGGWSTRHCRGQQTGENKAAVTDVATQVMATTRRKNDEKIEIYQGLKEELENMGEYRQQWC